MTKLECIAQVVSKVLLALALHPFILWAGTPVDNGAEV